MGYNTRYELTLPADVEAHEVEDAATELFGENHEMSWVLDGDSCKWYDHESEMRQLSLHFPGKLFKLAGEGEENSDIWKKEFKDGAMRKAEAVIKFEFGDWSLVS